MPVKEHTPGWRLRETRKQLGLTATALGKRIGKSTSYVTNQELGINGISVASAAAYAAVLGVPPQWLLYGDGDGQPKPTGATSMARGVQMSTLANGNAQIEMNLTLPFSTALKILALVEEAQK